MSAGSASVLATCASSASRKSASPCAVTMSAQFPDTGNRMALRLPMAAVVQLVEGVVRLSSGPRSLKLAPAPASGNRAAAVATVALCAVVVLARFPCASSEPAPSTTPTMMATVPRSRRSSSHCLRPPAPSLAVPLLTPSPSAPAGSRGSGTAAAPWMRARSSRAAHLRASAARRSASASKTTLPSSIERRREGVAGRS